MRDKLQAARHTIERLHDHWDNREEIASAFRAGLRALPGRYRAADPIQRRFVLVAICMVVALQVWVIVGTS